MFFVLHLLVPWFTKGNERIMLALSEVVFIFDSEVGASLIATPEVLAAMNADSEMQRVQRQLAELAGQELRRRADAGDPGSQDAIHDMHQAGDHRLCL